MESKERVQYLQEYLDEMQVKAQAGQQLLDKKLEELQQLVQLSMKNQIAPKVTWIGDSNVGMLKKQLVNAIKALNQHKDDLLGESERREQLPQSMKQEKNEWCDMVELEKPSILYKSKKGGCDDEDSYSPYFTEEQEPGTLYLQENKNGSSEYRFFMRDESSGEIIFYLPLNVESVEECSQEPKFKSVPRLIILSRRYVRV